MILKKQIKTLSTLQLQSKFLFGVKNFREISKTQRIRNFFDLDPRFPDSKETERRLYQDPEYKPVSKTINKLENIHEQNKNHFLKRISQYLTRDKRRRDIQSQKRQTMVPYLKQLGQNLFMDEETKLPFGLGFDEYIEYLKEQAIVSKTEQFQLTLERICTRMGLFDDIQLLKLFQFLIAEKSSDQFKNEARLFLAKRIVEELKKSGVSFHEKKQFLSRYVNEKNHEEVQKSLEKQNLEEIQQTIMPLIDQSVVDDQSKNIALQQLREKVHINEDFRKVEKLPDRIDQNDPFFSEESDLEEYKNELFNYDYKKKTLLDKVNPLITLNRQDFDNQAIYKQLKKNYYINKKKYYSEKVYTEQDQLQDKKNLKSEEFNVTQFLIKSQDEQEIINLIKKYNLEDELIPQIDFKDIVENLDYLADKAPTSIKIQISKEKNKDKNLKFEGYTLRENLKPEDFLWRNFQQNFMKIFPYRLLENERIQQQKFMAANVDEEAKEESDLQEYLEMSSFKQDSDVKGLNHLSLDHQMEIEIYTRQQQDPFFNHYIQNDIKYFTERLQESGFDSIQNLLPSSKQGDIAQYYDASQEDLPPEILEDESLRMKYEELKSEKANKLRIFGAGKRKTSSCLVMITEGHGVVQVNRKKIHNYFCHPFYRNVALRPLFLAPSSYCQYNIDFYVHGGGTCGQAFACQTALARAFGQLNPELRPLYLRYDLLRTDYRQKERKKLGKYKARKSYTYVRR